MNLSNKIPTYTVCGLLDVGKTTFIKKAITDNKYNYGVIQFEYGDVLIEEKDNIKVLLIPTRDIKDNIKYISEKIFNFISGNSFNELWIEVNGLINMKILDDIFHNKFDGFNSVDKYVNFKKTLYIADNNLVNTFLGYQSSEVINQIHRSDIGVIADESHYEEIKFVLKSINPEIRPHKITEDIDDAIGSGRIPPFLKLLFFSIIIGCCYYLLKKFIPTNFIDINTVITSLFGIILQSFPFLLIGVIISSIIQIFVPNTWINKYFPKDPLMGILFASFIGFLFPVCDCASIPVFRGLIKKGIPLPAAVSFMIATPVINPVVILSTYSAYNGNWKIVFLRCGLGFLCSLIIGLIFHKIGTQNVLKADLPNLASCSSYAAPDSSKPVQFIKHCQGEFFNVSKFLLIGALISSTVQVIVSNFNLNKAAYGTMISIIIMMSLGFLLSLCSSSDAVIARSMGTNLPFVASLSFLVFGPMLDLKNVILLSSSFNKKFIAKLSAVITLVCFTVMLFMAFI